MKYTYWAVLTPDNNSRTWYARVPDLPGCITTGHSLQDAILQITDAASGWLVVAEDEGLPIAKPTTQSTIPHDAGETLSPIQLDTDAYRTVINLMNQTGFPGTDA